MARLLNVSEQTVHRWVRERSLPVHRVGERYRFNRVELQEWAALHGHSVSPELFAADADSPVSSLREAILRGGVHRDVAGETREQVLGAVARLPGIPPGVNRGTLAQLLIGREALASTAVGDGIALPHPRDPLVVRVDAPHVLLCFLARPVEFGAMDGRPVRLLFTLLSPTVRHHLQMLARLTFALHDAGLRERLDRAAPAEDILERIREIESVSAPGIAPGSPAPGRE